MVPGVASVNLGALGGRAITFLNTMVQSPIIFIYIYIYIYILQVIRI